MATVEPALKAPDIEISTASGAEPDAVPPVLPLWVTAQGLNVTRHAAALRPFRRDEFGPSPAAPSEGHLQAVNRLMESLRRGLLHMSRQVVDASRASVKEPSPALLQQMLRKKDAAHHW